MKLREFLNMHDGGVAYDCISIADGVRSIKKGHQYCEEENQEYILKSEWFEKIADREVVKFCIIGGGMYKVELCIEIAEQEE